MICCETGRRAPEYDAPTNSVRVVGAGQIINTSCCRIPPRCWVSGAATVVIQRRRTNDVGALRHDAGNFSSHFGPIATPACQLPASTPNFAITRPCGVVAQSVAPRCNSVTGDFLKIRHPQRTCRTRQPGQLQGMQVSISFAQPRVQRALDTALTSVPVAKSAGKTVIALQTRMSLRYVPCGQSQRRTDSR